MALSERKIIEIDEEKCNGCGLCVDACHEGAIQMVNGKARLVSESYCDGLGDCLGPCPTGALSIVTRRAEAYDEAAVQERMAASKGSGCPGVSAKELKGPAVIHGLKAPPLPCGCPGTMARSLKKPVADASSSPSSSVQGGGRTPSELVNWPVQLKLVPPGASYLKGADILLAADCVAVAVPDFHGRYLRGKPVIIACPKLDDVGVQVEKLAEIIMTARPSSVTVVRMEVPCCGGLVRVAQEAVWRSGLGIPLRVVVVGTDGVEQSSVLVRAQEREEGGRIEKR